MVVLLLVYFVINFSIAESAVTELVSSPPNPWIVLKGQTITFVWNYTLDGTILFAKFANVTGGGSGETIVRHFGESTTVVAIFQKRFRADISVKRTEITLLGVQISDQGEYEFDLTASFGGAIRSKMELIINSPPKYTNCILDQTVNESTNLQLFCQASGRPPPNITWTRVLDDGSNSEVLHREPTWNFPNICSADAGTYRCTADNGAGDAVSHTVRVIVRFSPRITQENYFVRGGNAFLHCQVEAYPLPTITWKPCDPQESVCNNSFVNISNVRTPRANYTCTAANQMGGASATTCLVIGGNNIYLSVTVITGENCTKASLLKKFTDEMDRIFRNRTGYTGSQVLGCRHGSVILDVVLKFTMVVAEDFVISTLQNAVQDGKLGELSINASSIVGIPPVITSTTASATSKTTPEPLCSDEARRKERKYQDAVDEEEKNNTTVEMSNRESSLTVPRQQASESSSRSRYMALDEECRSHDSSERPQTNTSEVGQYAPLHPSTRSWEIPRKNVTIERIIGKGAFGQVAKGTAVGLRGRSPKTQVAVKMLKADAPESDRKDLLSELEVMKTLKPHPHVIKLLGCVTESEPLLVLIEYVPYGDLLGYLRKSRGLNDTYYKDPDIKPQTSLTSQQLMKFAWQIADGMSYLSTRSIIHRDLAARNVLVGEGETCKVTDFGMARDVQQENIYERKTKGRLPVKWTAYEALLYGTYTTKSDVWSYGVLLYEIFTIGGSPYPRMDGRKIANLLQQGYRMPKPKHVDDELYNIMTTCWQEDPNERPTFADLRNKLKQKENQHKRLINMKTYDTQLYANVEDLVD